MVPSYQVLKVFVSSPDDVAAERVTVTKVLAQVNDLLAHDRGLHLELVGWDATVAPGFGTEPQAVIKAQIGDDYDIFVGILWTRFGTPTQEAGSGTEAEFTLAYNRHTSDPDGLRIMFYFSRTPVVWMDYDLDQLANIARFRQNLPQKGGLYATYDSVEDFEESFRRHLGRYVREWGTQWGTGGEKGATEVSLVPTRIAETLTNSDLESLADAGKALPLSEDREFEEEGFLDLVESGTEEMIRVRDITLRMTEALDELGQKLKKRTEQTTALGQPTSVDDLKRAKIVVNATASDMFDYVRRMEVEIPLFSKSYSAGIRAYGRATVLLRDFGPDAEVRIEEALATISSLNATMRSSKDKLQDLRGSVSRLPRISTAFNQARTKTLKVLDDLNREFQHAIDLSVEAEDLMRGTLPEVAQS